MQLLELSGFCREDQFGTNSKFSIILRNTVFIFLSLWARERLQRQGPPPVACHCPRTFCAALVVSVLSINTPWLPLQNLEPGRVRGWWTSHPLSIVTCVCPTHHPQLGGRRSHPSKPDGPREEMIMKSDQFSTWGQEECARKGLYAVFDSTSCEKQLSGEPQRAQRSYEPTWASLHLC